MVFALSINSPDAHNAISPRRRPKPVVIRDGDPIHSTNLPLKHARRLHPLQVGHPLPHSHSILVATEAADEGINLQFCSLMVHYDIPWNPNRLEQRMGRIHRYGQQHEAMICNLVAKNTREGGKDYWLYVVVNCKTKPELYLIQDPASKLSPREEVSVVRYMIGQGDWKKAAEKR